MKLRFLFTIFSFFTIILFSSSESFAIKIAVDGELYDFELVIEDQITDVYLENEKKVFPEDPFCRLKYWDDNAYRYKTENLDNRLNQENELALKIVMKLIELKQLSSLELGMIKRAFRTSADVIKGYVIDQFMLNYVSQFEKHCPEAKSYSFHEYRLSSIKLRCYSFLVDCWSNNLKVLEKYWDIQVADQLLDWLDVSIDKNPCMIFGWYMKLIGAKAWNICKSNEINDFLNEKSLIDPSVFLDDELNYQVTSKLSCFSFLLRLDEGGKKICTQLIDLNSGPLDHLIPLVRKKIEIAQLYIKVLRKYKGAFFVLDDKLKVIYSDKGRLKVLKNLFNWK